jgi:AAA family ATP:ADP antiporter
MARPTLATGSGPDATVSVKVLVGLACLAAALLVAQQVAGKATRDTLFLSSFPVTMLPVASGLTAAVSLAGVLAFSRGMALSSPPVMMRWALSASAILLVGEWWLALRAPHLAAAVVYLHMGVFGATLISGFWSVVNERFDPYTARHSVGRIAAGASVGGVVGGLLTWRAAALVGVPTMLLAMAGLTLGSLMLLETLHWHERRRRPADAAAGAVPGPAYAFGLIRRDAYLRNVALLVGLCALTEAVLDYLLGAAATARFGRGSPLMSFFALYHTSVAVLALALQTTATRRSLETLGLGGTLAVQPAVIALGGALAAVVPGVWPRVALRGAQAVLRSSLFRSAYELLYTPLALERKRPTKALLDVGADRLGTIAGGAVVTAILLVPIADPARVLPLLASGLAVLTLMLARRLQKGYVSALAHSLHAGTLRLEPGDVMDQTTRATLAGAEPAERRGAEEPARAHASEAGSADMAADLRSCDPDRIRGVLAGDRVLTPELVLLVVPLLARDELFAEAVAALRRAASRCTGQLLDVLLDPDQDPLIRRRVPRVLKAVPTQRAVEGLLAAIRDQRFDVRYRSAQTLLHLREQDQTLSIPASEGLSAAVRELERSRPSPRGLDHVFRLLSLGLPGEPLRTALLAWRTGDGSMRGTALEYLENVLPASVSAALWPWLGSRPDPTGRTLEEMRDDLLRSTASLSLGRRSRRGTFRGGVT